MLTNEPTKVVKSAQAPHGQGNYNTSVPCPEENNLKGKVIFMRKNEKIRFGKRYVKDNGEWLYLRDDWAEEEYRTRLAETRSCIIDALTVIGVIGIAFYMNTFFPETLERIVMNPVVLVLASILVLAALVLIGWTVCVFIKLLKDAIKNNMVRKEVE